MGTYLYDLRSATPARSSIGKRLARYVYTDEQGIHGSRTLPPGVVVSYMSIGRSGRYPWSRFERFVFFSCIHHFARLTTNGLVWRGSSEARSAGGNCNRYDFMI